MDIYFLNRTYSANFGTFSGSFGSFSDVGLPMMTTLGKLAADRLKPSAGRPKHFLSQGSRYGNPTSTEPFKCLSELYLSGSFSQNSSKNVNAEDE